MHEDIPKEFDDFFRSTPRVLHCPHGCDEVFTSERDLKRHRDMHHTRAMCMHCGRRLKNYMSWQKHHAECTKVNAESDA